ncbi:hypothetical protein TVAG_368280 [Trichomonas vaginalis G3]|uniref:Leucine Rich Repeat family protein n=1 Tax=Trichomonas vaginalis (strain ATCC PRA-98 / G3) TaxID=412133 RepID=A2FI41_TRIV3|nr:ribonuclease inhibitor domain-containing protein [Trichomonas vaginalis G3]EAX95428.1 hypothetical protein TVAG_368280 [Trichomonas vaginalis G3]KAI5532209.1 ribonuclease inhibitor domain-containing protein [Trichomonas vaginalis G3]|eukprot:XP_001308358.1 hypothetical protein [Trichomonas vaginalis G3]
MDKSQWTLLYQNISNIEPKNLKKLIWRENPVFPEFFDLLESATELETLDLSGCFASGDDLINEFAFYLENYYYLKSLTLNGSKTQKLNNNDIERLLESLKSNKSISSVDLSFHDCSPAIYTKVKELLLSNHYIRTFKLEISNLESSNEISDLFKAISQRGSPINYIWSDKNYIEMIENKIIKNSVAEQLRSYLSDAANQETTVDIPIVNEKYNESAVSNRKQASKQENNEKSYEIQDINAFTMELEQSRTNIGALESEMKTNPPPLEVSEYDIIQPKVPKVTISTELDELTERFSINNIFNRIINNI